MAPAGLLIGISLALAVVDARSFGRADGTIKDFCDSKVYCTGELLKTIQLAEIFNDSKTFVDLSQINDPDVTLANFNKLMSATNNKPNRTQLLQYVADNFVMKNELHNWTLSDWQENPPFLKRIRDPKFREWAKNLNEIWKSLARKMNDDVAENPGRHSLIYVENGFVVPGGRFREFYYWDSYWVIEGLLIGGMHETARGMIDNFLSMVSRYGFIPNGGRVYYLMRSQPPLLIPMVAKYLDFTKDYGYLAKCIATLEDEFAFWQRQKTIEVKKDGKTYTMARYIVSSPEPRPESYKEDYREAQKIPEEDRSTFYDDIKAGAESGWDFSSRWFIGDGSNGPSVELGLVNISTRHIIPVDLNSILQQNARLLSEFHTILGNPAKSQYYIKYARKYQEGIDNVLWNKEKGMWFDYDMKNNRARDAFYPSNLTPLYTKSYNVSDARDIALSAVQYLKTEKIENYMGGVPASLLFTGEQWDFANAWPPLQSFMVVGLYQTEVKEAVDLAKELAGRWLRSNYIGYDEYGKMFEKYDATVPGHGGGGGEYNVQEGFGWTNGVDLEFLYYFPDATSTDSLNAANDDGEINEVDR